MCGEASPSFGVASLPRVHTSSETHPTNEGISMQAKTLARYGAPIAIVAGALMIITRPVILFITPTEIGDFKEYLLGTTHAINSVVSILAFASRSPWWPCTAPRGAQLWRVRSSRLRCGGGRDDVHDRRLVVRGLCGATLGGGRTRRRRKFRRGQADHRGCDQLRAVRHRLDHVRGGQPSGSCHPAKHLDHHPRGRLLVRRADWVRLPQRWFSGSHSSGSAYG